MNEHTYPSEGGTFVRNEDGSLTKIEGSTLPADHVEAAVTEEVPAVTESPSVPESSDAEQTKVPAKKRGFLG